MRMGCLAGLLSLGLAPSSAAQAVILETNAFITDPTDFNGFEAIASSPNLNLTNFVYGPANTPYSEGGLTVTYVGILPNNGVSTKINGFIPGTGQFGWYGAGFGYTDIALTGSGPFNAVQFLAGSGFGNGAGNLEYQVLNDGVVVLSGSVAIRNFGNDRAMTYYGFSGGGFDQVRLQVMRGSSFQLNPDPNHPDIYLDAGVFDSISAIRTVPGPVLGAGLPGLLMAVAGFIGWRRSRRAF